MYFTEKKNFFYEKFARYFQSNIFSQTIKTFSFLTKDKMVWGLINVIQNFHSAKD